MNGGTRRNDNSAQVLAYLKAFIPGPISERIV